MRVLGLCSYPVSAAATRFRMEQFVEPLRARGIELDIQPFVSEEQFRAFYKKGGALGKAASMLGPILRRIGQLARARTYDVLLVQREAAMFGPAIFEWLFQKLGKIPLVLDLDDATYVRYVSPTYGRLGSFFKFFGKTDNLIRRSSMVISGNRFIAEYAESLGAKTVVIPTVVDTDKFHPVEKHNDPPVIGWIGTHSTYPFLESIFPVLERLAEKHRFKLRIVGAGVSDVKMNGVEVENLDWRLDREIDDFATLDIGLYPIISTSNFGEEWVKGKSGFKAIQYMAVGVPFVMSPVGVCAEIGEDGKTHFNALAEDEWETAISRLLLDPTLREAMGKAGREHSLSAFSVLHQGNRLAETLAGCIR